MTSGGGGGDKPPRSELHDDPLQHPASEAGWDEAHPPPPTAPKAPTAKAPTAKTASGEAHPPPPTALKTPTAKAPTAKTASGEISPATIEVSPSVADAATAEPATPTAASAPSPAAASTRSPASPPAPSPTAASTRSPASPPAPSPAAASTRSPASSPAPSPTATGARSPSSADDEPVLPATYRESDLRAAVGASPLAATRKPPAPAIDRRPDDDDDDDRPPRNRTSIVVAALSITAGLAVAALVFVGRANSDRYLLACEAARAVPEQGRGFPPWGTHALEGEPWKPLKIAPETRCQPHETDDPLVLERLYLAMILDQATALLTAREVTRLDDAEALLKQALLLTRPPEREPEKLALERNEHHKEIERMLGDVTYWRASARLHDAATALADAAKQFDSAAAQHPRHVSDASAWATYARKLAQDLHVGPAGATSPASPSGAAAALPSGAAAAAPAIPPAASTSEHPNVPAGVALPVEPGQGSAEPPPAPAPPDAGVPTGGVLL